MSCHDGWRDLFVFQVSWRKLNEEHPLTIGRDRFVSDERVSIDNRPRGIDWNLVIDNVRLSDDGVYQCQISTKEESDNSHDVTLHVKSKQPSIHTIHACELFFSKHYTNKL